MTWENLQQLQYRVDFIEQFFAKMGASMTAVDLCCGSPEYLDENADQIATSIVNFPACFGEYACCDINYGESRQIEYAIENGEWDGEQTAFCRFVNKPDDQFAREDVEKCDVLLVLGHGGFEIDHNAKESSTLTESAHHVINEFKPSYIVLESVVAYTPIIDCIMLTHRQSYVRVKELRTYNTERWVFDRKLTILERSE